MIFDASTFLALEGGPENFYLLESFQFNNGRASSNTPPEVVRLLSQVKFNGKRNSSAFNHVFQFIQSVSNYDFQGIDEGILCRIFTLTFVARARLV